MPTSSSVLLLLLLLLLLLTASLRLRHQLRHLYTITRHADGQVIGQ